MNTALSQLILQADYDGAIGEECIDYVDRPVIDYQQIYDGGLPYEPYAPGVARAQEYQQRLDRRRADSEKVREHERRWRERANRSNQQARIRYAKRRDEHRWELLKAWDNRWNLHGAIDRLLAHDPLREIVT